MPSSSSNRDSKMDGRKARLEEQLKANLRKRKDQARVRAAAKPSNQGISKTGGKESER